jgi:aerobic-type carbon monoxide dehydrogenase small subunit (CoxS/CutS family)
MRIELKVNGEAVALDIEERMTLGDFLRERLHLTGTHLACEHGVCGACTVLVDDEPCAPASCLPRPSPAGKCAPSRASRTIRRWP